MIRHCLALDLKEDKKLIQEYIEHHKKVWPEIVDSIKRSGILDMQIYCVENRLFMIIEVSDEFSFSAKRQSDAEDEKIKEWENLMSIYQKSLPNSSNGEKWRLMDKVFQL